MKIPEPILKVMANRGRQSEMKPILEVMANRSEWDIHVGREIVIILDERPRGWYRSDRSAAVALALLLMGALLIGKLLLASGAMVAIPRGSSLLRG